MTGTRRIWTVLLCLLTALVAAGCGAEPLPEEKTESFLSSRLYAVLPDPAAFFGAEAQSVAAAGENGRCTVFAVTEEAVRAYAELLQQEDLALFLDQQYSFVGTEQEDEFWFFDYLGEHPCEPVTLQYEPVGTKPVTVTVLLHLCRRGGETTLTLICSEDLAVVDLGHRAP